MKKYMVVAHLKDRAYLTAVEADSALQAEHQIIDLGVCGRCEYAVTGAQAFDAEAMRTDTFVGLALGAQPITLEALAPIVEARGIHIREKERLQELLGKKEAELERLQAQARELRDQIMTIKDDLGTLEAEEEWA